MKTTDKKLELVWPNKDKSFYFDLKTGKYQWIDKRDPRVSEPRILIEKQQYGEPSANMLIQGDNLLALQALLQDFRNKIKLVFIDPPYNTGNAFSHYDDGLEHSIWLGLMRTRLELLHKLLRKDGSIWITIDDDESHYLKVLCDEIFGRQNFVANVIWQKKYAPQNDAKWLSDSHDHVLVYAKNKETWRPFPLQRTEEMNARYKNPDNDPRGVWKSGDYTSNKNKGERPNLFYPITNPNTGVEMWPSESGVWRYSKRQHEQNVADNLVFWGKDGKGRPAIKRFLADVGDGSVTKTIWLREEVGDNQEAKRETRVFNVDDVFSTPKPERLLDRILDLGSKENDWVLDSFAGSGTTGAVAQKKKRKWIMVELGDHAKTHIIPRMEQVISGNDQGGISKAADWQGGSGFNFYELGESLFVLDDDLRYRAINPNVYNGKLIRAVLKIEGFKLFHPDNGLHGKLGSTVAHVTEAFVTQDYINALAQEVQGQAEFVALYAQTHASDIKLPDNFELRRIPETILRKFAT